jgi:flagellar biosynthesis protein FlhF
MATTTQPQIRVKSYFATSIPDAIDLARKELGPDALLLNSRQAPPEARHLGPIEVVFGENTDVRNAEPASSPRPPDAGIDDLRQKVEEIRSLLIRAGASVQYAGTRPRLVEQTLLEAGLTRALAAEIDQSVALRLNRRWVADISDPRGIQDGAAVVQETIGELNDRIQVKPDIGRVTALVGPPGSGKTTTLVKLAIREGLMKGRPVRLISADAQRIAASEQLRIYAAILGVPFQSAESMSALAQATESGQDNALLLIDTPGLSPALLDGPGANIAAFLSRRQDIDTHLVLTASMRPSDLENTANRFEVFHPSALIFTKLDETDSFGAIFCEAVRTKKPVSFFCDGQLVPENIEPASRERLTESLVRQLPQTLQSAA